MEKYLAKDSLPAWFPLHHFNEPAYNYQTGVQVVDPSKKSLWAFMGMVAFNPIFWNFVARNGESASPRRTVMHYSNVVLDCRVAWR